MDWPSAAIRLFGKPVQNNPVGRALPTPVERNRAEYAAVKTALTPDIHRVDREGSRDRLFRDILCRESMDLADVRVVMGNEDKISRTKNYSSPIYGTNTGPLHIVLESPVPHEEEIGFRLIGFSDLTSNGGGHRLREGSATNSPLLIRINEGQCKNNGGDIGHLRVVNPQFPVRETFQ